MLKVQGIKIWGLVNSGSGYDCLGCSRVLVICVGFMDVFVQCIIRSSGSFSFLHPNSNSSCVYKPSQEKRRREEKRGPAWGGGGGGGLFVGAKRRKKEIRNIHPLYVSHIGKD
ncbi:hypothetical protein ACH5RR_015497 [Cinchona calisaya]|uniref:Uncharacterized protein n=1 Tax=Cinchona calisaya TaxID=153742 RepID=A0ABD2ZYQ2_9GENT